MIPFPLRSDQVSQLCMNATGKPQKEGHSYVFHIPRCLGSFKHISPTSDVWRQQQIPVSRARACFLSKSGELPASPNAYALLKAKSRVHEVLTLCAFCLSAEMAVSQWHFGSPEECHLLSCGFLRSLMHG